MKALSDFVIGEYTGLVRKWDAEGSTTMWATAENWDPDGLPFTVDQIEFDNGGTVTVTAVPTTSVKRLAVSNNTMLNLQSASAITLTLSGAPGVADLDVASGSALNLDGTIALTMFVGAGATGSISGSMTFSNADHRLNGQNASAISFNNGSTLTQASGCTGNIFTSSGTANVVRFLSGSTFISQAGSNPFALTAPSSKVVFESGSLYRHDQSTVPSISGRTYANFELNASVTITPTGSGSFTAENLTVTNGTFNITSFTGAVNIKGNISVASGKTLNFNRSGAATINLNGTSNQTVSGSGTLTVGANETAVVNNAAGVTLRRSVSFDGTLTLTNGTFSIGANTLTIKNAIGGTTANLSMDNTSSLTIAGSGSGITIPNNVSALNNLTLDNTNGTLLGSSLSIDGTLTLANGSLSIGSNTMTINGAITTTGGGLLGGLRQNAQVRHR